MPLTKKGKKIQSNMKHQYGTEKGEKVFYASKNAGKVKGVDNASKKRKGSKAKPNPKKANRDAKLEKVSKRYGFS